MEKYASLINRNAFLVFFYLRLIPSLPYEAQNYIAGVSRISRREFFVATALGIGPIIFILAFLGDGLTAPGSPAFWLAAVICLLAVLGPVPISLVLDKLGRPSLLSRIREDQADGPVADA